MSEENKAVVRRLFEEVFNDKELDRADELVAQDYLDHGAVPGQGPGLQGAKQDRWAMYFDAVPDMHVTIEDMLTEGDKLAVRYTVEGTQRGELMGVAPTGERFRVSGISIYRLAEGKIAEQFEQIDMLGLMEQLGVMEQRSSGK